MDYSQMSLAQMERVVLRERKRMIRLLSRLDVPVRVSKPNGHVDGRAAWAKKKKKSKNRNLVLQGKYMNAVRSLKTAEKLQVKKTKLEHGYHAALKLAKTFRAKHANAN